MMGVSNLTTITPQGAAMKGNCSNCSAFVKATSILLEPLNLLYALPMNTV